MNNDFAIHSLISMLEADQIEVTSLLTLLSVDLFQNLS